MRRGGGGGGMLGLSVAMRWLVAGPTSVDDRRGDEIGDEIGNKQKGDEQKGARHLDQVCSRVVSMGSMGSIFYGF
ncbi:hypothetical protein BJ875DRAFT_462747 [Amylocarpus encephaloides]|uniref:Uncharacterized protein n=1 Tax=Amylocarpus encephaloides TaxID=45428 RepID=A0A9P7YIV1_9HELO|nr:hypothetical protein BJ875DRAFT_462747 [Amylocarpus encephaloides]